MILVIAEKPLVARAIADVLPGADRKEGSATVKGDYTIINAFGHLMSLKMPEDYDPELKKWTMERLPIFFPNWEKKADTTVDKYGKASKKERLEEIGRLLKNADTVIHAGDPDDEGQYLIDEILEHFNYTGKVLRINTYDTAPAKIKKALENMDDNTTHIPYGQAAYARSVADLTVGVNLSRYFTLNNPQVLLTIGRVQTPTLGLVYARDQARNSHKSIHYFTPQATVEVEQQEFVARYVPNKDDAMLTDGRILSMDYANRIANMLKQMPLTDGTVTKANETEDPPLPFNLTKLNVYAERKWGYTPQQVLDATQSLRDNHNAISYNRSDCQYLSSEQHKEAPAVMAKVVSNIKYAPKGMDLSLKSKAFDDKYLEGGAVAHLAIIPQAVDVDLSKLSPIEKNLYLAICQFYMAQFMPKAKKIKTKFSCPTPDNGTLEATSSVVVDPGYRVLFSDSKNDEESPLSKVPAGTHKVMVKSTKVEEGTTSPPPAYTQATLGDDMSKISKYVSDPEIRKLLLAKDKDNKNENGSIGTEATRAPIITGLLEKGYLYTDDKNKIHVTPLGEELIRILPKELVEPNLTALWWVIQEDIKNGNATPQTLEDNVLDMVRRILNTQYPKVDISKIPANLVRNNVREVVGTCPRCGQPVIEGKLGFGCTGYKAGCKFVIWKSSKMPMLKNVTFTVSDAKAFLAGKPVHKKNLVKKAGGTFEGDLIMTDDPTSPYGANISLDTSKFGNSEEKKEIGICPRCGKPVVETKMGFSCSGYKDGCSFIIWKQSKRPMFQKIKFTENDAKAFLAGKPVHKKNLLKKSGETFESDLIMTDDPAQKYGVSIDLAPREGGGSE